MSNIHIALFLTVCFQYFRISLQLLQTGGDFLVSFKTDDNDTAILPHLFDFQSHVDGIFTAPTQISSKLMFTYGDFLARFRIPFASGTAFSSTCYGLVNNPVDTLAQHNEIRFCFNSNNSTESVVSYFVGKDIDNDEEHIQRIALGFDAQTSSHDYLIKWRRNGLQFVIDGSIVASFQSSNLLAYPWQNLLFRLLSTISESGEDGDIQNTSSSPMTFSLSQLGYIAASNINSFVSPINEAHVPITLSHTSTKTDGIANNIPFLTPGGALVVPYTLGSTYVADASAPLSPILTVHSNSELLKVTLTAQIITKKILQLPGFSYRTRVFCLLDSKCDVLAPTLTARPGDTVFITIVNTLMPHHSNTTNFRMRGVRQTEQQGISDSGSTSYACQGGDRCTLSFTIPNDAAPGLHWYHSSSALHIMSGMAGAFILRPANESALPVQLQTMQRETLVFTHVMLSRNPSENPSITFDKNESEFLQSLPQLSSQAYSEMSPYELSLPVDPSHPSDVWLTNGQYQPSLAVRPNEWRIFDILTASADRLLELETRTGIGYGNGIELCRTQLLALDGIYLETPRSSPPDSNHSHVVLLPGSRATIAVSCPRGTHYLQSVSTSNPLSRYAGVGSPHSKSAQLLLTLIASGEEANGLALDAFSLNVFQTSYLSSLISNRTSTRVSVSTDQAGSGTLSWLGAGSECVMPCFTDADCVKLFGSPYSVSSFPSTRSRKCSYLSVPERISTDPRVSIPAGEIVEITIWGRSPHVVPLHFSSPFQLVSFLPSTAVYKASPSGSYVEPASDRNGTYKKQLYAPPEPDRASAYGRPGDWRDTFPALAGRTILRGRFVGGSGVGLIAAVGVAGDRGMRVLVDVVSAVPTLPVGAAEIPAARHTESLNVSSAPAICRTFTVIGGTILDRNSSNASMANAGDSVATGAAILTDLHCDSRGDSWGYSETVDLDRKVRVITANGCPNHFSSSSSGDASGKPLIRPASVVVPLYPQFALRPADTTCTRSALGFAVNGVGIFSRAAAIENCIPSSTFPEISHESGLIESGSRTNCSLDGAAAGVMFCGDFLQDNLAFIDACGGSTDSEGNYGYRIAPQCLIGQLAVTATPSAPSLLDGFSPQVGWALDGFPIFGPLGPRGVEMLPCLSPGAHPTLCLDQCNGYRGELSSDRFLYRYYLAGAQSTGECSKFVVSGNSSTSCLAAERCCASNVPGTGQNPYSIGCLVGCVADELCASASDPFVQRGVGFSYDPEADRPLVPSQAFTLSIISSDSVDGTAPSADEAGALAALGDNSTCLSQDNRTITVVRKRLNSPTFRMFMDNPPLRLLRGDGMRIATFNTTDISMEPDWLPSGAKDAYIFSLAASADRLFFATPSGVFSADKSGSNSPTLLIAGIMVVDIFGNNFGMSLAEVFQLLVRGSPCGSIAHVNSSHLQCILTMPGFLVASPDFQDASQGLVPDEVYVSVQGGEAHGPYLTPETIVVSRSGRPVIARVSFTSIPFRPHAVFLHRVSLLSTAAGEARATLYFSNVAVNGSGLYRCFEDGAQVETVVKIERIFGITAMTADCLSGHYSADGACDLVLYTHEDGVSAALVPRMSPGEVYRGTPRTKGILAELFSPVGIALDFSLQRVFVSFKLNTVLRMDLQLVHDLLDAPSSQPTVVPDTLLDRSSRQQDLALVVTTNTLSRLGGITLLPLANNQDTLSQQRLLVVDLNRNLLTPLANERDNGAGVPIPLVGERSNDGAVLWPTALVHSPTASNGTTLAHVSSNDSVTVYISEMLGRIWEVTLYKELDAKAISRTPVYKIKKMGAPKLLLDLSNFPGSTQLREIAYGAVAAGVPIAYRLTIDVLA